MAGMVHTLGPGVTTDSLGRHLKEGDRITFAYIVPCMHCYNCLRGERANCPNKFRYRHSILDWPYCNGGYSEYYYLYPGHFVFKTPDSLSDETVTPVKCALSQVTYALHKGSLRMGDSVVVQGAGGLGINAAAVAKEMGAGLVISIDGVVGRLALAKECGADETININDLKEPQERVERVRDLTEGRGADVVMEVVGFPQAVSEGLDMLRVGGTYLEIGHIAPNATVTLDMSRLMWGVKHIVPTANYDPWVIPVALDFLVRTKDKYPLSQVVSHKFPLEDINDAFRQAEWLGRQDETKVTRAILVP